MTEPKVIVRWNGQDYNKNDVYRVECSSFYDEKWDILLNMTKEQAEQLKAKILQGQKLIELVESGEIIKIIKSNEWSCGLATLTHYKDIQKQLLKQSKGETT